MKEDLAPLPVPTIDTNYVGFFPIIDRLFGTHRLPAEGWPERYGVVAESVPRGFMAQQIFPFARTLRKLRLFAATL